MPDQIIYKNLYLQQCRSWFDYNNNFSVRNKRFLLKSYWKRLSNPFRNWLKANRSRVVHFCETNATSVSCLMFYGASREKVTLLLFSLACQRGKLTSHSWGNRSHSTEISLAVLYNNGFPHNFLSLDSWIFLWTLIKSFFSYTLHPFLLFHISINL